MYSFSVVVVVADVVTLENGFFVGPCVGDSVGSIVGVNVGLVVDNVGLVVS